MNGFRGRGAPLGEAGFAAVFDLLGVAAPEVWAVLTVETRGCGFLPDRRPLILFERHVFRRETEGKWDHEHPDLSNPRGGGYVGGAGEYGRLARAIGLDRLGALRSASWGLGQVMGFNHRVAGYGDVESMVEAMLESEDAQLLAMARFVDAEGLSSALRSHHWAAFARGYNGPDFARNQYDARLAAAYARFAQGPAPDLTLRSAQVALTYLGYTPGPIDGIPGRFTRSALSQFQAQEGLDPSGDLDLATAERLWLRAGF
jgi:hypothetical protein